MELANRLEGINEYYFSQKLREIDVMNKEGKDVISLGIGSPDLPPHIDVIKVLQEESAKPTTHAYQSYKGSPILRNAFSIWYKKWYQVDLNPEFEILPLIGSKEGIMHICMTYLNEGDFVLIPNPGYPTYKSAATIAGGKCIEYNLSKENNWLPNLKDLENNIYLNRVKIMFINYPHMPTGQLPTLQLFEQLIKFAKKYNILLVHDNPYSFILNDEPLSILKIEDAKDCAIELNSLSKSHNMAGWRIGAILGSKEKIDDIMKFKSNMDSGMFLPLQLASAKALTLDSSWHNSLNDIYKKRREKVFELLNLLQCNFDTGQAGMFVWASIPPKYKDGYELSDSVLIKANVFITPGGIFGSQGNNYIRVSLCCKEENISKAIERVKASKN